MPNNSGTEVVARVEQFGMKLAHQFPWNPAAGVAVGLALRRRFLSDPEAVSHLTRRQQIMAVSFYVPCHCPESRMSCKQAEQ